MSKWSWYFDLNEDSREECELVIPKVLQRLSRWILHGALSYREHFAQGQGGKRLILHANRIFFHCASGHAYRLRRCCVATHSRERISFSEATRAIQWHEIFLFFIFTNGRTLCSTPASASSSVGDERLHSEGKMLLHMMTIYFWYQTARYEFFNISSVCCLMSYNLLLFC